MAKNTSLLSSNQLRSLQSFQESYLKSEIEAEDFVNLTRRVYLDSGFSSVRAHKKVSSLLIKLAPKKWTAAHTFKTSQIKQIQRLRTHFFKNEDLQFITDSLLHLFIDFHWSTRDSLEITGDLILSWNLKKNLKESKRKI